jgi:hypothetical protein
MNLTSQQKDLLFVIVDEHLSATARHSSLCKTVPEVGFSTRTAEKFGSTLMI